MEELLLMLTLALPLLSAAAAQFLASEKAVGWITSTLMLVTLTTSLCLVLAGPATREWSFTWWQVGNISMEVRLLLTPFTKVMLSVVALIAMAVHVFSIAYIAQSKKRYYATLSLFTWSMLGLLVSDHLMVLFCFWELMGICSYLLIGFWRERPAAGAAATKAFLMNKVGDAALLACFLLLFVSYGSFHLSSMIQAPAATTSVLMGVLLYLAIAAKSAQWPLHTWLPDAMEGPTPVSALIHAATMVAAGVILYARVYPLFTPEAHAIIGLLGLCTACLGGYQALLTFDLKKILAYSTLSQLGLMIATVATGAAAAGLIHLFAHAFFKAGLFLAAAVIIRHHQQGESHTQDIRQLGGLRKSTRFLIVFAVLISALGGIPFSSGFLSKENMLAGLLAYAGAGAPLGWVLVALFLAATFLTIMYCWRLVVAIFRDSGSNPIITFPVSQWVALGLLAAGSGWYMVAANPVDGNGWLSTWLQAKNFNLPPLVALASVLWIVMAGLMAHSFLSGTHFRFAKQLKSLDDLYLYGIVRPVTWVANTAARMDRLVLDGFIHGVAILQVSFAHMISWLDQAVVDGLVKGTARLLVSMGNLTRKPLRGEVQRYLSWATLAMIIFLFWMLN